MKDTSATNTQTESPLSREVEEAIRKEKMKPGWRNMGNIIRDIIASDKMSESSCKDTPDREKDEANTHIQADQ